MPEESKTPSTVRFGPFELSTETGELCKHGIRIKLFGQPIKVLTLLVAAPGQVVTREQLQKSLWPGETFGDFERGLNAAVNRLRENLGDSATEPKYIETVPGRGYRFIAEAKPHNEPEPIPPPPIDPGDRPIAILEAETGAFRGQSFTLTESMTGASIGRMRECEICVEHPSVSRLHSRLIIEPDYRETQDQVRHTFTLIDSGSRAGTMLNGELIVRAKLRQGDRIQVGAVRFRFVVLGDAATKPDHSSQPPRIEAQNYTLVAFVLRESAVERATGVVVWVRHEMPGERCYPRPTKAGGVFYERAFTLQAALDERGTPKPTDFILRLDAPNFEPVSQIKKLNVPPGADSAPCTFLIKPSLPGKLVANLELLNADEKVLASRFIRIRALHMADDDFRSGFSMSFGVLKRIYEDLAEVEDYSSVETPALEPQTRLLEAAAPKEATVGCSIEVVAMVRERDSEGGLRALLLLEKTAALDESDVRERPFEVEFPLDAEGKPMPLSISLRLESPGFEPPSQIKKLKVPPTGNSPLCTFLVTPRIVGEHVMNLELVDPDEQVLVSRSIRTKALPSGMESSSAKTLITIPLLILIHGTPAKDGEPGSKQDEMSSLERPGGPTSLVKVARKASEPSLTDAGELADKILKEAQATGEPDSGVTMRLTGFPEEGMVISHYRLIKIVGQGGMGAIFKAEDLTTGRIVAVKFLAKNAFAVPPQYGIEEVPASEPDERDRTKRAGGVEHVFCRSEPQVPLRGRWWLIAAAIFVIGLLAVVFLLGWRPW